ncbi:MAG: LamG-like jellyroll fold domain-containing protein, partial [Fusobacteriaceae bacterium]
VQLLYKIAFQDLDAQKVVGKGWTEKQASAITGSTMELGNRSGFLCPFEKSVDKPHNSISMGFGVGENGEIVQYNNKDTDPMPIKTINMSGLQKWEETEDYIIYLDKDAVIVEGVPTEYEACFRVDKKTGEISTDMSPSVVTRGLIEHFDFADGKGTEATLKSRVSDNVLTVRYFSFDKNSGWTGKGLKFDGVSDFCELMPLEESDLTFCLEVHSDVDTTERAFISSGSIDYARFMIVENQISSPGKLSFFKEGHNYVLSEKTKRKTSITFTKKNNEVKIYLDKDLKLSLEESNFDFSNFTLGKFMRTGKSFYRGLFHSVKIYNRALTEEEVTQNYEYEQSIDRTSTQVLPDNSSELSYGIGLSNQLSDEQKASFRLSVDGTKFVAGMRYCEELEVVGFTYADVQLEMEKEEWMSIEEKIEDEPVEPTETIEETKQTEATAPQVKSTPRLEGKLTFITTANPDTHTLIFDGDRDKSTVLSGFPATAPSNPVLNIVSTELEIMGGWK